MGLVIKDPEVERLVLDLARRDNVTVEAALRSALLDRLGAGTVQDDAFDPLKFDAAIDALRAVLRKAGATAPVTRDDFDALWD